MVDYVGEVDHYFVAFVSGRVEGREGVVGNVNSGGDVWDFFYDPRDILVFHAGDDDDAGVGCAGGLGCSWTEGCGERSGMWI